MESEIGKYRHDLSSVITGATAGVVAGVVAGAVVAGGAVAGAVVAGGVAGAVSENKSRCGVIGGLSGLIISGLITTGSFIGYDRGHDAGYDKATAKRLVPFQTETDRGILVEKNYGAKIPYVFTEQGDLVLYESIKKLSLETLTAETLKSFEERENAIYNSLTPP